MDKITPHLVEKPWAGAFIREHLVKTESIYANESRPSASAAESRSTSALTDGSNQNEIGNIGEAWLVSTLKGGESQVGGRKLSDVLGQPLDFLVKLIDAKENLSVQVHPNDTWAKELENSRGKTECWLILHAEPGAGVYLGLKTGVSASAFDDAVRTGAALDSMLGFFPVQRGDFISVPAGTIHAIGAGVTLLEVQQSSGITYRVWDWNRTDREIHVEKALKVYDPHAPFEVRYDLLNERQSLLNTQEAPSNEVAATQAGGELLMKHDDFECHLNESTGPGWFIDLKSFTVQKADHSPFEEYVFVK